MIALGFFISFLGGMNMAAKRRATGRKSVLTGIVAAVMCALVLITGVGTPAMAAADDISVSIRPDRTTILSGETVSFEVSFQCGSTNNASCDNGRVEMSIPLGQPDQLEFEVSSYTAAKIDGVDSPARIEGTGADRKIVWDLPATMTSGQSGTASVVLKTQNYITPNGTTVTPVATFFAGQRNATATSVPVTITSQQDLKLVKTKYAPSDVRPYVGSDITYLIRTGYASQWNAAGGYDYYGNVCNVNGLWAFQGQTVVDTLPPGTVFRSANAGGVYDPANHTVTWQLGDSVKMDNGQPKCDASTFAKELLVTVNYPEDTFTDGANRDEWFTNDATTTTKPWLRDTLLRASDDVAVQLRVGADGEFTVQKGISYTASNGNSRQFWRGAQSAWGDWVRGYLHTFSIEGTGNATGTWSLADTLPCGWTSPSDPNRTDCATPAYTDIAFGANGSMSELKVHWTTNKGRTGVCTIPEGFTAGDTTVRTCEGLENYEAIPMGSGEWITKFTLDENPMKAGTKGKLFLFGTVSTDIPLDNSQAVANGEYQPHFFTNTSTGATTPMVGVTPASEHPLWVTIENCTSNNTVRWNGGQMTTNGALVDSDREGRCGYTRIARDIVNVYAEKRVYNPEVALTEGQKSAQAALRPGDPARVEVLTERDDWDGQRWSGKRYTFTPTVTEVLPANLELDTKDPAHPVYLSFTGQPGSEAQVIAKLGQPRFTVSDVVVDGVTRTKVVIDFPNVPEGGALAIGEQITVGFDARVRDSSPMATTKNNILVQAAESADGFLVCASPSRYADSTNLGGANTWGDVNFTTGVQGPDATSGCRAEKMYSVLEGPSMSALKSVQGANDTDFVPAPGIGSTDLGGAADYRIAIRNSGNVDMRNFVAYDLLPRVGDHGVRPGADARGSEFNVYATGPVTGLPADAVVQYSTSDNPCRGELAGNGGGALSSAPAGCTNDWNAALPSDWSKVTGIRIDFGDRVWKPGDAFTGVFPAQADGGDLTGIAWNNVAIAANRNSDGSPVLPTEAAKVGLQLAPDLSWRKVDGANTQHLLAGSEWTLTPVVPAGGTMPAGVWPRTIADCTSGTCSGEDRDAAPGRFTLAGIPWGSYDLAETKAPNGYVIAKDPIRVVIGPGKLDPATWTYELGDVVNFLPGVDVSWEKVDPEGDRLAGSAWELIPVDEAGVAIPGGTTIPVTDCVAEIAEDCAGHDTDPVAGKFRLTNIPPGTYHLVETQAPAGFVKLTDPVAVTVGSDGPVSVGPITNHQVAVPALPLTGGLGSFLFLLGGGAFLALTAVLVARSVRTRNAH